jgi:hypothetical protein
MLTDLKNIADEWPGVKETKIKKHVRKLGKSFSHNKL